MELDEFVAKTLEQIIKGVADAQVAVRRSAADAVINPYNAVINPSVGSALPPDRLDEGTGTLVQEVSFDVAVTVSESGKSGAGLQVGAFGVGGKMGGGSKRARSEVSRIKFVVPVVLPMGEHG